jgi:hypothetical protein
VRVLRPLSILALALSTCPLLSGCVTDLDVEVFTVLLKHSTSELVPIINYDLV